MLKVYCEANAMRRKLRALHRAGRIDVVHFPYDPDSHMRKVGVATPSGAQFCDLNLSFEELPGRFHDYEVSTKHEAIVSLVGASNRRDALHVDSAYKHGCHCFFACDPHIIDKAAELESLLGIKFLHPDH